ncbi:MAG TPA: hypothetical protein VEG30_15215 [Terriglobales bacterium]|nr:hypothetical protein [Terriglobales bacterium]
MTCAEFQKVLPDVVDRGGDAAQDAHLRSCPACSELLADLRLIAQQARQLLPTHDPHPRVWENIRATLEEEGLIRSAPVRMHHLIPFSHAAVPWLATAAAIALLVFGAVLFRRDFSEDRLAVARVSSSPASSRTQELTASNQQGGNEEEQLIRQIAAEHPTLRDTYENSLKQVDAYISDAQRTVEQNPYDEEARQSLIRAYDQKAMIYQMGLSRSME